MPIVKICRGYHVFDPERLMEGATKIGRQVERLGLSYVPQSLGEALQVVRAFGAKHVSEYGVTVMDDAEITEYSDE